MVQICFDLKKDKDSIRFYKKLLANLKGCTPNEKIRAIDDVLSKLDLRTETMAEDFYRLTIDNIRDEERIWFNFAMELCHSYLATKQWRKIDLLLYKLHDSCRIGPMDDIKKADYLVQVYAIKIERMFAPDSHLRGGIVDNLEDLYKATDRLSANVTDHRSQPIIAEFKGKYHAHHRRFEESKTFFFEAIKYNEAADRAKVCVQYYVIASILAPQSSDPFASTEVKIYENDRKIIPVVKLYEHFTNNNVKEFDLCVKRNEW